MNTFSEEFNQKCQHVFYGLANEILSYLNFSSLMQVLGVSSDFYNMANQYFKYFMLSNNLIRKEDQKPLSGDHFLKLFRSFYSREVIVSKISPKMTTYEELQFLRYPRCSTYGVKDFSMSNKFTVFLLYNNDLIFLKTEEEYMNPLFNMQSINKKNVRKNVKKFFTSSKHLYYLTSTGQLHAIFYSEEKNSHQFTEGLLESTIAKPLKDCAFSYSYAVLVFNSQDEDEDQPQLTMTDSSKSENDSGNSLSIIDNLSLQRHHTADTVESDRKDALNYIEEKKQSEQQEEQKVDKFSSNTSKKQKNIQDIQIFSIQEVNPQDLNASLRLTKAKGLDDVEIMDLTVGQGLALFIDKLGNAYELDFSIINNNIYMIFPSKQLANKKIKRVWSGFSFYFAMEQDVVDSIEDWDQSQIQRWLTTIGFDDYKNIIKYEGITGKTLVGCNKSFLIDKIGMVREDLQTKFLTELTQVSQRSLKKPKLYGWGNNQTGQLGTNTGTTKVSSPVEIQLPDFAQNDSISHIECGWNQSVIKTRTGKLWVSELPEKKQPKEKEVTANKKDKGSIPQEKSKSKKGGAEKKSKKGQSNTQIKEEKESTLTSHKKWVDITPICQVLKDKRTYKTIRVSLNKEIIAILGANQGYYKKEGRKQSFQNDKSFCKFKGADHIYNRILWDKSFNKEEFIVGVEDRFLGILEIPFIEFEQKSDFPSHRIKFFKRNGELVWDRVTKMNNL